MLGRRLELSPSCLDYRSSTSTANAARACGHVMPGFSPRNRSPSIIARTERRRFPENGCSDGFEYLPGEEHDYRQYECPPVEKTRRVDSRFRGGWVALR